MTEQKKESEPKPAPPSIRTDATEAMEDGASATDRGAAKNVSPAAVAPTVAVEHPSPPPAIVAGESGGRQPLTPRRLAEAAQTIVEEAPLEAIAAVAPTLRPSFGPSTPGDAISPLRTAERASKRGSLDRIGHLRITGEIARGGMGVVYRAEDEKLGRAVALKVLLGEAVASPSALARFEREARAAASLRHPNIVGVYDVGNHEGLAYFTMDLIEGRSLSKVIAEDRPPLERSLRTIAKIARALQFAHERKVVHRDVKPSNVLIDARGEPYLTDFGLAMLDDAQESRLTKSGAILGTPAYMPPEQADGRRSEVGPRSDVYSLGATLYEMLTLRAPFLGSSNIETIRQVMERDPVRPTSLDPRVPVDVETIVLRALEKDPAKRYQSAEEFAADIDRFLAGEPIAARPAGAIERFAKTVRRHPAQVFMGVVIFGLLVAGGGAIARADAEEKRLLAAQELSATARAVETLEEARGALQLAPFAVAAKDDDYRKWLERYLDLNQKKMESSDAKTAKELEAHLNQLPIFGRDLATMTGASFVLFVHDKGDDRVVAESLGFFADATTVTPECRAALEREALARVPLGDVFRKAAPLAPVRVQIGHELFNVVAQPWKKGDAEPDALVCLVVGYALDQRWLEKVERIVLAGHGDQCTLALIAGFQETATTAKDARALDAQGAIDLFKTAQELAQGGADVVESAREDELYQLLVRRYPKESAPGSGELYARRFPRAELRERLLGRLVLPIGIAIAAVGLVATILAMLSRARAARAQREESDRLASLQIGQSATPQGHVPTQVTETRGENK